MPLHDETFEFLEGLGSEIFGVPSPRALEVAGNLGEAAGGVAMDWLQSAFTLLGDVFDPFLPGGAASETRVAARGGRGSRRALSLAGVAVAGVPVSRRRRRRALTNSDKQDLAFITATLGAPAAKQALGLMISRT